MADIIDDDEYDWLDASGRSLSDYSPEELLDQYLRGMASFVEYMGRFHQGVFMNWFSTHRASDFVKWLRALENTGL